MNSNYFLIMTVLFLLWVIGLIDINKHLGKSKRRKKEWAVLIAIGLANIIVAIFWGALLTNQVSLASIESGVAYIQNQGVVFSVLVFGCFAGIWVLGWNLFNDWIRFRITSTLMLLTVFLVILFANGPLGSVWREWTAVFFFAFLGAEIILQLLSIPGWLPSYPEFQSGIYHPFGRIYQKDEGFTNGMVNRYGLHQPDQKVNFDPDVRRVVLMGGSYVQGFQVAKHQHLGHQLERQLNAQNSNPAQVFALGMPDVGIGLYMHDLFFDVVVEKFQPDEIIFLLHASSDFQYESDDFSDPFLFDLENDTAALRPDGLRIRHALQHIVIRGYHDQLDPLKILKTHLLLPKFFNAVLHTGSRMHLSKPADVDDPISTFTAYVIRKIAGNPYHYQDFIAVPSIPADGNRNFLFERESQADAKKSAALTMNLYQQSFEYLQSKQIKSSVVTIPALSPQFFEQPGKWSPLVGAYDLFSTERVFQDFTSSEKVKFLGMGSQFQQDQLSLHQIKSFYYMNGRGHFTPAGHTYFAENIYKAFFASESKNTK